MAAREQVDEARKLRKIAEGREAEMFAWGEGTILRLLRNPGAALQNQWQAAAMEAARSRGVRVPAVHDVTAVNGRPGIVMERIEGTDLLTLIGRRPWLLLRAARISGELHAQLHEAQAPSGIPPLNLVLRMRIESAGATLGDDLKRLALEALDELPEGDRLCHGDFHPANILMDSETPVLIDWSNVTRGDPMADVARTRMILRLGEPPPGTSIPLRAMALVGRNLLLSLYLRSYRRRRPLDIAQVERWEVPVTAARLAEGITEEVPALLRFLERARRRASG
ncbi:MAG: aminoglycoside phosphotransferase family protein [Chloroflexi bacterium]|nr:aminoglycoside phosphotransferase family protein [Chloroflexota bacterium]